MPSKLAELRSRTDRQLLIVVRKQLDRALMLASVAAGRESPLYAQAARDFAQVTGMLPRIGGLTAVERAELEGRLKELGAELELASRMRQLAMCS